MPQNAATPNALMLAVTTEFANQGHFNVTTKYGRKSFAVARLYEELVKRGKVSERTIADLMEICGWASIAMANVYLDHAKTLFQ